MSPTAEALIRLWDTLEGRYRAVVRRVDIELCTPSEIEVLTADAQRRLRALDEGDRAGWRPREARR